MALSVGIDGFPQLVFVDNKDDRRLDLTLSGIDTAQDLFQFFVNLLTRGIVILYGRDDGTRTVHLDSLDEAQMAFLVRKFRNIGVVLSIDVEAFDDVDGSRPKKLGAVFEVDDSRRHDVSGYALKLSDVRRTITVQFKWGSAP